MKILFVTFCLAFFFPAIPSQDMPPATIETFVSCGKEVGISGTDIEAIRGGNLSGLGNLLGCFSDCVSKKAGIIEDNVFQQEVFKERLSTYISEDRVQNYVDECAPLAGTEECKISGKAHGCVVKLLVGNLFS